jgi:hypothetical protein
LGSWNFNKSDVGVIDKLPLFFLEKEQDVIRNAVGIGLEKQVDQL